MFEKSISAPNTGCAIYQSVESEALKLYDVDEVLIVSMFTPENGERFMHLRPYQIEHLNSCHFFKYKLIIVYEMTTSMFERIIPALSAVDQPVWLVNMALPVADHVIV